MLPVGVKIVITSVEKFGIFKLTPKHAPSSLQENIYSNIICESK